MSKRRGKGGSEAAGWLVKVEVFCGGNEPVTPCMVGVWESAAGRTTQRTVVRQSLRLHAMSSFRHHTFAARRDLNQTEPSGPSTVDGIGFRNVSMCAFVGEGHVLERAKAS